MPFGNITANTKIYEPRTPGTYVLSTVTFGQPSNEFRIRGASLSKDGLMRASVIRVLQKDVIVGSASVRKESSVGLNIVVPSADFTAAEIDTLCGDISEFLTVATVTRLMQGES